MTYLLIQKPPENLNDCVNVPPNEVRDEFVKSVVGLLRQDGFRIKTDGVPLAWLTDTVIEAAKDYRIMIQRIPVNLGEQGTARAIFYFERQPSK